MPYSPRLDNLTKAMPPLHFSAVNNTLKMSSVSPEADPTHIHDFWEFYFNESGDVSFLVDGKVYPVRSGDAIVSRPNQLHMCVYNRESLHGYFCLWIEDCPALNEIISPDVPARITFPQSEFVKLRKNLVALCLSDGSNAFDDTFRLLSVILSVAANKKYGEETDVIPKSLQDVLDYVKRNIREITGVSEICDKFFLSPSTLDRMFRKHLGLTPKQYITSGKLSCAKQLLLQGESVEITAFSCGFADSSRFISVFKNKFGLTPRAFYKSATEKPL